MQAGALALDAVSVRFGGIAAVSEATVAFAPGTINGLIGPNGAGKTLRISAGMTARLMREGVERPVARIVGPTRSTVRSRRDATASRPPAWAATIGSTTG